MKDKFERARRYLSGRRAAYRKVFNSENVYTASVLRDLSKFCRAQASTFHTDSRAHAVLEGRREVWLRIQQHLNLSEDEIFKLHNLTIREQE